MKTIKYFTYGTLTWISIFLVDYLYELFQINTSGTVVTLTGLRITTKMTAKELDTRFTLTISALIIYLIFIVIWVLLCHFISYKKNNK